MRQFRQQEIEAMLFQLRRWQFCIDLYLKFNPFSWSLGFFRSFNLKDRDFRIYATLLLVEIRVELICTYPYWDSGFEEMEHEIEEN